MPNLFSDDDQRSTDLIEAILDGDVQRLKQVLSSNRSFGSAFISLFYCETPMNLNATTLEEGVSYPPLSHAIIHNDISNSYEIIETLLEAGADPNFTYRDPLSDTGELTSPLLECIGKYCYNYLDQSILDLTTAYASNNINQFKYQHGQTVTHKVMQDSVPEINVDQLKHVLTKLKEAGADLEQRDSLGNRAISYCPDAIRDNISTHIQQLDIGESQNLNYSP